MKSKNELSNGILDDRQLSKWCNANVEGFRGVIDRTSFVKLYKHMNSGDSCIINLDPHYEHGGSHWVAFRISSEAPIAYYKDSFGAPPPDDIMLSERGLIYGNRINQKMNMDDCGRRAAYFLRDMAKAAREGNEIECFEKLES